MLKFQRFTTTVSLLALAIFAISIGVGSNGIFMESFNRDWALALDLRLPRALTAALAGAAVAVAGALSQAVFRNALATPSILGTEAGASLGLALYALSAAQYLETTWVILSTIAGAALATTVSLSLAVGRQPLVRILLGGFALNSLLGACTALITSWLLESGRGHELYHWLLGSFSGRTWLHVALIAGALLSSFVVAILTTRSLDILSLGEESARSLGVSVFGLQVRCMLLIAVLVGASMAVGGALPFVGLIVPHFVRISTGPYMRPLLLNSLLGGAVLALAADLAARTVRYPVELNVGLLTTIIGAPYFIFLLRRQTAA